MSADAYWRENWEPPRKLRRGRTTQRRQTATNDPERSEKTSDNTTVGDSSLFRNQPGLREGLRIVPLVAGCALVVFVLIAVIETAGIYAGALSGAAPEVTLAQPATPSSGSAAAKGGDAEAAPVSTPRNQWKAGVLPFLYQTDPAWANTPYSTGTIATAGCGPTCLSMVYIALTGRDDYDPKAMAAFSTSHEYLDDNLTSWRFMSEGAAELGLASHEVPADADRLRAELQAGRPVICSVMPGDFTAKGHFIVLAGLAENGELVVHDPNSPTRSAQTWDIQRVLNQCRNLWAFSRA